MFKDLKQILRKEQCDASILLTANVPSAKKIIVHGPQGIYTIDNFKNNQIFQKILIKKSFFFRARCWRNSISVSRSRRYSILSNTKGIPGFFRRRRKQTQRIFFSRS